MNLHKKVVLLVILILVSILSIYSYYMISDTEQQVLNSMKNSAALLAESLERGIVTSGAMDNRELLQKLVMDFNKVDGIHEIYVIDRKYNIIAHPDTEQIGRTYANKDVRDAMKYGRLETEYKDGESPGQLYDVVAPVVIDGKIVGAIEVELGLDKVREMIYSATAKAVISITITIVVLAATLIILLLKIIIKPLENIVEATNQIAAGSFQTVSTMAGKDEIGQLTASFNEMVCALQKLSEKDKSANPLTGLPGNVVIREQLEKRLERKDSFSVLYIDLDNFKQFNDTYGFEYGDEAIKFTASIIQQSVEETDDPEIFVGHIGGDDFVAITSLAKGEKMSKHIVANFEQKSLRLYQDKKECPLSISVAHIMVTPGKFNNALELGEMAAEIKKQVKKLTGSNYLSA